METTIKKSQIELFESLTIDDLRQIFMALTQEPEEATQNWQFRLGEDDQKKKCWNILVTLYAPEDVSVYNSTVYTLDENLDIYWRRRDLWKRKAAAKNLYSAYTCMQSILLPKRL